MFCEGRPWGVNGRTFALVMLFLGAMLSFGLAMWSAANGRLPIVETAHAILFAVMAMLIAASDKDELTAGCAECGAPYGELDFCLHCGRYPKVGLPERHEVAQ